MIDNSLFMMTEMEPSRTLLVLLMELQRLFPATGHGGWICVLELQSVEFLITQGWCEIAQMERQ